MASPTSRRLFQQVLDGEAPRAAEISALVKGFRSRREVEGQWFDVKAGVLLQKRQSAELRAAVSAFANADGGLLLIGYDEHGDRFDGVADVGKQQPEHWAANALGSLASQMPFPRTATLRAQGVQVLLLAVERAARLVYVIENGEPAYYLRFGHQSLRMPSSLVSDLLLGRRAQPQLTAAIFRPSISRSQRTAADRTLPMVNVNLGVRVENDGLTTGRSVIVGLVAWTAAEQAEALPSSLSRSIDVSPAPSYSDLLRWQIFHHYKAADLPDVRPFQPGYVASLQWCLPVFPNQLRRARSHPERPLSAEDRAKARGAVEMEAALYVLADNAEPRWHQLAFSYDESIQNTVEEVVLQKLQLTVCFHQRPRVSVRFMP